MTETLPKRLIEVDLPIKRISAHARREKSIRHGHISTLHIWWARRPLAACRAVICAALWPDPADEHCPQSFREAAAKALHAFGEKVRSDPELARLCQDSWSRWVRTNPTSLKASEPVCWPDMRYALLDFIADFANWDASTVPAFLDTSRVLTQSAHEALGGEPGTRPLIADPFAGGGSIPLEALRVGADAFASDVNPVAVLLNKVVLEYIPKYGQGLADEVRKWGGWVRQEDERELEGFYPKDPDGATPIAYLWARTIRCEGPGCGAEVPLIRSLWLSKKSGNLVAMCLVPQSATRQVDLEVVSPARVRDVDEGTVRKGSATCPVCGFTTPVTAVRRQLHARQGGTKDARLLCVALARAGNQARSYRAASALDVNAARRAADELMSRDRAHEGSLSLVPSEPISLNEIRRISAPIYGMTSWGDLFTPRQALLLSSLARLVREVGATYGKDLSGLGQATQSVLALSVSRFADICNSLCQWENTKTQVRHLFTRQAVPMLWDFAEPHAFAGAAGDYAVTLATMLDVIERMDAICQQGRAEQGSATSQLLPDEAATAIVTDPPYYDAVPYAYLSDFFYVWLRRCLNGGGTGLTSLESVPKEQEIVVDRPHELSQSTKDVGFYERELGRAFAESGRVCRRDGIGVIVFASKTTASWEAVLRAIIEADWTITGSWPLDTELETRIAAQGQARLASSIHLAYRPRQDGQSSTHETAGDWRDVLGELPKRIHEWLPRLVSEGVVGADAIFACLGPALEVYSRYPRVEKASGEQVRLGEYLEHVWAVVSREALSLLFQGAEASGLEPDARLTAMWLWTLSAGQTNGTKDEPTSEEPDEGEGSSATPASGRYALEFDAARKIAQGLGAHLDKLRHVVEVKGETARLLSVGERARYLFETDGAKAMAPKQPVLGLQADMFTDLAVAEREPAGTALGAPAPGSTTLDRVHQAMILFGAGRAEALKRFVSDGEVGIDRTFWHLAQILSALYPSGSDEKRWVDGVLARKKSLGF